MKKVTVFMILFAVLIFLFAPAVVIAEGEALEINAEIVESELPTTPFTWEQLATIAGCALATLLIVQLLKLPIDRVWKIPTRIIVFLISAVIMVTATYFSQGLTWSSGLLCAMNAIISALSAMGAYEMTFAKADARKKIE